MTSAAALAAGLPTAHDQVTQAVEGLGMIVEARPRRPVLYKSAEADPDLQTFPRRAAHDLHPDTGAPPGALAEAAAGAERLAAGDGRLATGLDQLAGGLRQASTRQQPDRPDGRPC